MDEETKLRFKFDDESLLDAQTLSEKKIETMSEAEIRESIRYLWSQANVMGEKNRFKYMAFLVNAESSRRNARETKILSWIALMVAMIAIFMSVGFNHISANRYKEWMGTKIDLLKKIEKRVDEL